MGFRLGHRIVKIWRWIKRSRKPRSYARLLNENRKKSVCLRIGRGFCRRSTDSQSLAQKQVSLLNSEDLRDFHLLHLRHLDLQSLHFPRWQIASQFHTPAISDGYEKGFQNYESCGSNHVPKGFLAVYVGQGEEHQRFEIPVPYFNHPLFGELLKEAEEEYGFDQRGAINIPCKLSHFENVRRLIHWERSHKHKH